MPDEPNVTPTPQSTPTPMADPQKLVDEALSAPTTSTTEPTTPSMSPPLPPIEEKVEPVVEESKIEETIPAELLPQAPAPAELPPTPPVEAAPEMPSTEPASVPSTEEVPLAFASSMPTETPRMEETVEPTAPNSMPTEAAPVDTTPIDTAPPVFVPPVTTAASMTPPMPEKKKKSKAGKVIMSLVGMFLMVTGIYGGWWYYKNYLEEHPAEIAAIGDRSQDQCHGCSKSVDGGWLKWKNGRCTVTGICNSSKGEQKDTPDPTIATATNETDCKTAAGTWCSSVDSLGKSYAFCISNTSTKGCNNEAIERGYTITYGANASFTSNGQCPAGFSKQCQCGPATLCFDKTGVCNQADANTTGYSKTGEYNKYGLCAIAGTYHGDPSDPNAVFEIDPKYFENKFSCTDNGCTSKSSDCVAVRYRCNGTVTGNSCTNTSSTYEGGEPAKGTSLTFTNKCGTVEQIDIMCDGKYVTSRTRRNGDCQTQTTTPSTPPTTPTLACTGLTKDKAAPKIGDQVQFTCAGTVTPAGATNLTYQFQIKKDAGEWATLTATGNKAIYTVPSAGSYQARCKACGTINNASVCDPTWTGVTQ